MKRKDYINWDEYFMGIAILASYRSKDPNTAVGACIVNNDNIILSIGYNGAPRGLHDDNMPWEREGDFVNTKYAYVCHSELNAILNYRGNVENTKMYVTLFPCNECAKAIVQAGIKEVIYLSDKYNGTDGNIVSKKILDEVGIKYTKYEPTNRKIEIDL